MKFIAGLLLGGLATLLVATLADYRWEPPSRMKVVAASAAPLVSATESEPELEQDVPSPIRSVTIAPLPAEPAPTPAPLPASVSTSTSESAVVPPVVSKVGSGPERSVAAATPRPAPDKSLPVLTPAELEPQQIDGSTLADPAAANGVATAVIWKPFHSEVSATGFARRLSTQLGYPFRALREGPARYHVVFDYDTEQQRELLQQQVTALTGFVAL